MPDVKYCYRCGRRVSPEHTDCWYCGTTLHRTIRPERRCPYCDEIVRERAIKCANCGEFLDQPVEVEKEKAARAKAESAPPPGPRVEPRRDRTIEASARPDPGRAIEQKSRLKLEAPTRFREEEKVEGDAGDTAESPEVPESVLKGRTKPKDLIRVERDKRDMATVEVEVESAPPPARRTRTVDVALPPDAVQGGEIAPGLFARIKRLFAGNPPPPPPRMDVRERSRYRICAICGTEILSTDNYCFHCGQKYAREQFRFSTRVHAPLNFGLYAVAAICLVPHLLYFVVPAKSPGWLLLLSGVATAGVLGYSATNSIDRRNRAVSWILLLVAMGIIAVPLLLEYGPE